MHSRRISEQLNRVVSADQDREDDTQSLGPQTLPDRLPSRGRSPGSSTQSASRSQGRQRVAPSSILRSPSPRVRAQTVSSENVAPHIRIHSEGDIDELRNLAEKEGLPSSFAALQQWSLVAADRAEKKQQREDRLRKEEAAKLLDGPYYRTYERLRAWADRHEASKSKSRLPFGGAASRTEPLPPKEDLIALAKRCYPPRCDAEALIFDFGDNEARYFRMPVGKIEPHWESKPDWVRVRWIHLPFSRGVTHSSCEDLFNHRHPLRKPFPNAGEATWPFLQTEVLTLRSSYDVQRMRDVYVLLKDMQELTPALNKSTFANDLNPELRNDMEWRADYIGTDLDFWSLCQSDVPTDLQDRTEARLSNYKHCIMGPRRGLQPISRKVGTQSIEKHPYYTNAKIIRDEFRAFCGQDGYLLTMSAAKGVDYLDKILEHTLSVPWSTLVDNPDATVIGRCADRFKKDGTKEWHRKTPEWLLVYLVTELASAPHNFNAGHISPSLAEAYSAIVADLGRRRYDKWQKDNTVALVRDYLETIDELHVLVAVYIKRVNLFKGLILDCEEMEAADLLHGEVPDNPAAESIVERARSALSVSQEDLNSFKTLLSELKEALNALFQLRSIEQDELATIASKQNRAVVLFTGVTIVFLPLGFLSSYFGMNLQGIVGTTKSERYFWSVCGSIAFTLVIIIILWGFRHHFSSKMHPKAWWRIAKRTQPVSGRPRSFSRA